MRKRDQQSKLRVAAKIILGGWVKGTYERNGCHCAMGAINKAVYGTHYAFSAAQRGVTYDKIVEAEQVMYRFACFLRGEKVVGTREYNHKDFETIEDFNDKQAMTKEEVANALIAASHMAG